VRQGREAEKKNSVIQAQAGIHASEDWIPIYIGMTNSLLACRHRKKISVTPGVGPVQAFSNPL
jgi:hypothetical protein